jgi:hypothetical protein
MSLTRGPLVLLSVLVVASFGLAADVTRLDAESWQEERDGVIAICGQRHSETFARAELEKGDRLIQEADHPMAHAIRVVGGLCRDGVLEKPEAFAYPFPDLLSFHDAVTPIEQRLFVMFPKHRIRAFQETFHSDPDYALWYNWSELVQHVAEIQAMAEDLRRDHAARTP